MGCKGHLSLNCAGQYMRFHALRLWDCSRPRCSLTHSMPQSDSNTAFFRQAGRSHQLRQWPTEHETVEARRTKARAAMVKRMEKHKVLLLAIVPLWCLQVWGNCSCTAAGCTGLDAPRKGAREQALQELRLSARTILGNGPLQLGRAAWGM